ncbi:unnamed protein product [Caenorhabditis angaria]|uniref:Protein RFT1 homolog n=1 Tax=Caenorhabditis angaria TaxID=860376 RepID=A0A9P1N203_9PELO|nr:unnamed protein product [Caenorhabditis angaria]
MASLFSSFGYNFGGQLIARVVSFAINMYLLRKIDNDVLGLVNVRLTLLYTSILFLTREPMRKANIMGESQQKFINLLWMSPIIATFLSFICIFIWLTFSTTSENVSSFVLLSFPISAIIETLAEPFAVIALRFNLGQHFAIGQGILVCMKRIFVFFALILFPDVYHLDLFAYAQYFGSISYLIFNVVAFKSYIKNQSKAELKDFQTFETLLPKPSEGLDSQSITAISTMFSHSILKQLITDGSAYIMTFTDMLSLKNQAVFDAVERVGSLVARTILAPLEENCYAHFANHLHQQRIAKHEKNINSNENQKIIDTLATILHIVGVIGCVVCVFGIPYSPTVIHFYGGTLLSANGGAVLLSLYSAYVFVMAVNGITECFAMASMDNKQVLLHGKFLFFSAIGHLTINYVLCVYLNSAGFIVANIINMIIRIGYSWRHISTFLGPERTPSIFTVLPTSSTVVFLFASFFATGFSYLIFGATPGLSHTLAHLAIGAVLFSVLSMSIAQHDPVFFGIINGFLKDHTA